MNISLESVLATVCAYVKAQGQSPDEITADTPLLQGGYLDSFGLVDFIDDLKTKLEITLDEQMLLPEDFETTAVLHTRLQEILA